MKGWIGMKKDHNECSHQLLMGKKERGVNAVLIMQMTRLKIILPLIVTWAELDMGNGGRRARERFNNKLGNIKNEDSILIRKRWSSILFGNLKWKIVSKQME